MKRSYVQQGVSFTLVIVLVVFTVARNATWRDGVSLWRDVVSKAPGNMRAIDNLCFFLAGEKKTSPEVLETCRQATDLQPGDYGAHINLWRIYTRQGMGRKAARELRVSLALLNSDVMP